MKCIKREIPIFMFAAVPIHTEKTAAIRLDKDFLISFDVFTSFFKNGNTIYSQIVNTNLLKRMNSKI